VRKLKKRVMRRLTQTILALGILVGVFLPATISYAGNDDFYYKFYLQGYYKNSHSEYRYRETADPLNLWKVQVWKSGETTGSGDVSTFWLEISDGTNVSPSMDVEEGWGYHYATTTTKGTKTNVRLTAENNNFNGSSFYIEGFWDEEIGSRLP
jgi:hypothetical protein